MNALARLLLALFLTVSLTQQGIAAIVNSAVAIGDYQASPVTSNTSLVSIPVTAAVPEIELQKASIFNDESGDGGAQIGESISYSFTVRNTGNVTLTNITVTDPTVTLSGGPLASLLPGASDLTTFTATHTITAGDLVAGQVANTATASGQTPSAAIVTDDSDSLNPGDDTGADNDPTITPLPDAVIDAVDNDFTGSPINSFTGGSTPTAYANDTLNGSPFAPAVVVGSVTNDGGLTGVTIAANGTLVVPIGTPAGTYTVSYQICEVANPTNCDIAQVTGIVVTTPTISAVDDDFSATPVNGAAGGNTATVFTNDLLNGNPFAPASVTPAITADGGLTGVTINPDGTLTVPPGRPAGSYVVTYRICEVAFPTNCDTANATVVISASTIVANDDDFTGSPINGLAGGATPTVFTNDTLNGVAFAPAAVTPTITNVGGLTGVTINADGTLFVPAGATAGTYPVTYQICEVLNPSNCDTAIATVVVNAATIVAADDNFSATPLNGATGGTTPTVFTNDTLNGVPFAPAAVTPTITNPGGLTGVAINPDGTLSVPAGTPAGTYPVTYQICEVLNPTNCDTAVVTVVINPPAIVANDDNFSATPVNGLTGGATPTVYTNDTLNGAPFAPAAVTPTITNAGGLTGVTINPAGTLSVPVATPAGTYPVTYQICEVVNPTNCDTAIAIVVVNPPAIVANDDNFSGSPVNGLTGGDTPTVYTNDTLNGAPFAPAAVTPTITNAGGLTGVTINASGTLTVPPGTPAGTYPVTYQICEVLNPTNCDTAVASVLVSAATISAVDDNFTATPINGLAGGATTTVYVNDTLNGVAFAPAAVTPTITANGGLAGVTIDANGLLLVPAGSTAGTYVVTYQICEAANPTNCDTANATILINPPAIVANDDDFSATPVNGLTGATTATVYTNDTLNGVAFAPATVTPSITNAGGLTGVAINPDGTLTVPAGTSAGSYSVTYQICEVANPANCDTAIATVVVNPPAIVANDDNFSGSPVNGLTGGSTPTVYTNDTLNGVAFAPAAVTPSITNAGGLTGVAITPSGTLTVPAGTPAGTYPVTYQICEVLNPTNCDTAVASVLTTAATISAVDDNFTATPINGATGGSTTTVYVNDTLNGVAFAPAAVTPTITGNGGLTGVTVNASGLLAVPAGTPAATYVVTYQICEVANPTNCDTANAIVVVNPPAIVANDDNFGASPVNGFTGGATPTVYTNDTLNGVAFAPAAVTPTITNAGGLTGATITPAGAITVPAGTPAGSYPVTYQICEVANPANCDTAIATVVVNPPAIVANDDDFSASPVSGLTGGSTPTVYANDTLNGVAFAPAAVTPTITNAGGLTGVAITPSGTLTVPAGTPAGSYPVTYQICEVLNPTNCDTAIATVVVTAATISAVDDNFSATPINALTGGSTTTVFVNDTLNGVAFAPAAVTPTITGNGGLTGVTIDANGLLAVPAGSTPGTYVVTYQICEAANPANCDTANATIVLNPPAIVANDDNFNATPINGLTGGATPTVYTNDTLNGVVFAPAAVTPTITNAGGLTGVIINAGGTLTVPAGTPAGSYPVTYQICEVANPANCDTAIATVLVNPPAIVANDDNFGASPVNGLTGGSTPTVYTNDTLNGVAFAPAAVTPTITNAGGLTGATITAAGAITVPAGTPAGSYPVTYQICEVVNPANCDTAIATVVVNPPAIVANDDNFAASPVNGLSGGSTPTVYTNDTLNGAPFAPASVTPTITNVGGLTGATITPAGAITVPAGTPAGSYPVTYQICEIVNPANCDTAIATVVVTAPTISAVDDNFSGTPVNGAAGGTTATVFTNDTLNGAPFAPAAVTPTITANGGLTGVVINPNGTLTVPVGAAPGAYTVTYQICEVANPANCDTANVAIVVNPPVIDAVVDDFTSSPVNSLTGGTTPTVFTNDTLNGVPVTPATVTPTITNVGGLTGAVINPNGTITVPAGAAPGTYAVTYQICQTAVPANCDTAVATVVVTASSIAANDDTFTATPVNGTAGGPTPTVLTNDTLNGTPVTPATVTPTLVNAGGMTGATVNPDGTINVPAGTPAGTYNVTYQICEIAQPANCDTAVAAIAVTNTPTDAIVTGTVFFDTNGNGIFDGDPNAGPGYIVEIRDSSGAVVGTTTTNGSGQYTLTVAPGSGYSIVFMASSGTVVGGTPGLNLPPGTTLNDQNQPIDPSGIVYNSVTRAPVAGVVVTLATAGNVPLPAACLIDASQQNQVTGADGAYRFDVVPGADPACPVGETEYHILIANPAGYVPGLSPTMPPQPGALEATACAIDASAGGACQVSPSTNPPVSPAPGIYYTAILLQLNDPHVVHNHLPIDPIIATAPGFTKKALILKAKRGEKIPFVIEATMVAVNPARIVDIMPAGLDFVPGSATVNGIATVPAINGNRLTFDSVVPDATGAIRIELVAVVTVAATTGPKINKAQIIDPSNGAILATAQATITIAVDHVFDCGDVIGKVFDDKNRDGYQDKGEPGLAGVRLVTVKGVQITTDKDGLFHVPCAELPDAAIGSNFILKLDTRTLPSGYRVTTENPRIVRLTAGKATKLNFGASVGRVVKFDVTGDAFVANSAKLKPQWASAVDKLVGILAAEKSILRLTYVAKVDGSKLAAERLAGLEKLISSKWKAQGAGYDLPIEKRLIARKAELLSK